MFDFEELISWADKHGLDEQVFPRDKRQLAALEELMLIDCQLTELPESIALLSQLKKLNINKNQITELPDSMGGCRI